jgi:hypothetical protein
MLNAAARGWAEHCLLELRSLPTGPSFHAETEYLKCAFLLLTEGLSFTLWVEPLKGFQGDNKTFMLVSSGLPESLIFCLPGLIAQAIMDM